MTTPAKPKTARGDRTPDAELTRRIHAVGKLLIAAVEDSDIVQFCADKWQAHEDTARRYIAEANAGLRDAFKHDRAREGQKALRRYQELFRLCCEAGDLRAAATMQDRICKLLCLWDDGTIRHEAGDSLTDFIKEIRAGRTTTLMP
jgi:hypothetical protein